MDILKLFDLLYGGKKGPTHSSFKVVNKTLICCFFTAYVVPQQFPFNKYVITTLNSFTNII